VDTVLGPETTIFVKSPREISDSGPSIHYANADPQMQLVTLCASDYQGIETVIFLDKGGDPFLDEDDNPIQMIEEIPDSGFYYLFLPDPNYVFEGTERVVVTNLIGQEAERTVDLVYYEQPPQPEAPVFNTVQLDIAAAPPVLYANVTNPNPMFPIKWVKVFHSELDDGVLELLPPINSYEDPDGWVVKLPEGWIYTNLKVVAYIQPGIWSEVLMSPEDVTHAVLSGTVTMYGEFDWTATDEWRTSALNFDTGAYTQTGWYNYAPKFGAPWDITHWATQASSNMWWLYFAQPNAVATKPFEEVDPSHIINQLQFALRTAGDYQYAKDDVLVFESDEGHLVKFKISGISNDDEGWPDEYHRRWLTIQYVVYNQP
jgi:hypothetical protein